jgi:uncharacterized protein (TIGR00369 family)
MSDQEPAAASREHAKTAQSAFVDKLGIVIDEWSNERVVATMPVAGNTQPDGWLHGGATCSLIESIASLGAAGVAGWPAKVVMGQQQTTSFLGTSKEGSVRGVATPVHIGRSTHVWNVDVTHVESGKLVASGRVTMAVREPRKPA